MVAYSFAPRFVEPILAGTKRQTLRGGRRRHARPGEELQLYTGMRTKHCRLIARARCEIVASIFFDLDTGLLDLERREGEVRIGEVFAGDLDAFARRDGFGSVDEFAGFWRDVHGVTRWRGFLIGWAPIAGTPAAEMAGG